jgi:hypothetical protein
MSYNTKYKVEFEDRNDNDIVINLKKLNHTGSFQILKATNNPVTISYLNSNVFDAVKTAGVTIQLISESDRQLIDLYTANYKEWQIEILKNNSIIFNGYLSAEMYSESFAESFNYDVSVEGNNGIGILSRERYIKSNNTNYRGVTSVFQVIKNCIDKIGIEYESINIATDLKINNTNPATNKSVLQHLTINNDNFIDEDGIVMNCMQVLESVLLPLNLSLFIENNKVYIVDFEYLKKETITLKKFLYTSTTCTNHTLNIVRDLNSEVQVNSSFDIEAGVNNYVLLKNRYIKNIIDIDKFENENIKRVFELNQHSFDPHWSQVSGLGGPGISDYIYNYRKWIAVYSTKFAESFWNNNSSLNPNLPVRATTDFYNNTNANPKSVSFFGGIKDVKVVDDVTLNWDDDGNSFKNYLFINNPVLPYDGDGTDNFHNYRKGYYEQNVDEILKIAASFDGEIPVIFNSNNVFLHFTFNANIVKISNATAAGGISIATFSNTAEGKNNKFPGSYYVYGARIFVKDENGNKLKYLKNTEINVTNQTDLHPVIIGREINKKAYEWVTYKGNETLHQTTCKIIVAVQNEALNPQNINNEDVLVDVYCSANPVNHPYQIEFSLTNMFYEVVNDETNLPAVYLQSVRTVKQSNIYFAVNNIGVDFVNKDNLEPISIADEELHYYLSEQYKTEEIKDEITNYTGNDKYIVDMGGITFNNEYITSVKSSSYYETNFEDLKGEKVINQFKNNNINLNMDIDSDDVSMLQLYKLNSDPIWNNKKWVMASMENNVVTNEINLKLKELF